MAAVIIAAAVGAAVVLVAPRALTAARGWWLRRHELTECTGCGRPVRTSRAVTVGDTYSAHDGGIGGTGVYTDWHPRCLRRARRVDEQRSHQA